MAAVIIYRLSRHDEEKQRMFARERGRFEFDAARILLYRGRMVYIDNKGQVFTQLDVNFSGEPALIEGIAQTDFGTSLTYRAVQIFTSKNYSASGEREGAIHLVCCLSAKLVRSLDELEAELKRAREALYDYLERHSESFAAI